MNHSTGVQIVRRPVVLCMLLLVLSAGIWPAALGPRGLAARQQAPGVVNYYLGDDPAQWRAGQPLAVDPELVYSTFLGGNGTDDAHQIALDGDGNIYIIGRTNSVDFVGTTARPAGRYDVMVVKLDPTGTRVLYITFVGGSGSDDGVALAVNQAGEVWATVQPGDDFPVLNTLFPGEPSDFHAALIRLSATGQLNYSARLNLTNFNDDMGQNIGLDQSGNIYVTGRNTETFTTPLLKINASGTRVVWERSYGERLQSVALAVNAGGRVYMTGTVENAELPVTPNALQTTCNRWGSAQDMCSRDAYILVAGTTGELQYASYFGGSDTDRPETIAVDGAGAIYLGGQTFSKDFPVRNAIQASCPSGLGDEQTGCFYYEGFVTKLSADGRSVVYSTYLDATIRSSDSSVAGIVADSAGNAYLTGRVAGADFPLKEPVQPEFGGGICSTSSLCYDAFVTKLDASGALVFSTYLGGAVDEFGEDIAVNADGNMLAIGTTDSLSYPVTDDAIKPRWGLNQDVYLTKIGESSAQPGFRVHVPLVLQSS